MKKGLLFLAVGLLLSTVGFSQTIADARAAGVGATVTVTGVALNGSEFGSLRFIQDATGGVAAYSATLLSAVNMGDNVTIAGTLKEYKYLLEIDPITTVTVNSTGNALPAVQVITPSQVGESYESELVQIQNATFAETGNFAVNTNYTLNSGGQSVTVRITGTTNPLIGVAIPTSVINLTAIVSQYHATDPAAGYQLLIRQISDLALLGVNQISSKELNVYPNPSANMINVTTENQINNVIISDLTGRKVLTSTQSQINVSNLSNGIYMVQVTDNTGRTGVTKFVKN